MKKNIYLLLALLTATPSIATQNVTKSIIIASTLLVGNKYNKKLSLDLHKAIENEDYTSAQKLINTPQVDINAKVDYGTNSWGKGRTPLIMCCRQGDKSFNIARSLLNRNDIEVNLQDNDGNTPLIMCCYKRDRSFNIARALLAHNDINVNLRDKLGRTPLSWCCLQGQKSLDIAQALLGHKNINVNLQHNDGWTPLIMCAFDGDKSLDIAQALLGHKNINVNLQNNDGWTPLDWIIYWIKKNKKNYTYVNLWNALVAKGAILNNFKTDYNNLNPSQFKEPQKVYIKSIKNNPPNPIKAANNLLQESNRLRKELENLKQQHSLLSNAHYITSPLVLIAGASTYQSPLSNLPGALKDITLCRNLFADFYHYDIECTYNTNNSNTKSLTLQRLNNFIGDGHLKLANNERNNRNTKNKQYDALIFIWAGHGGDRTLITSDNRTKNIADIKTKFDGNNAHFFVNKPKIIIKAACRGVKQGTGVQVSRSTDKVYVSPDKDFVFIYANTEFKTIRDSMGYNLGSYFTEKLYEVLKHNFWRTQEIGAIIMRINNRVQEESEGKECVEGVTTKTKLIFFRKHIEENEEETKEDE